MADKITLERIAELRTEMEEHAAEKAEVFDIMHENFNALLDLAEVALKPPITQWQPISTAPKDGTRILCYFPGSEDPDLSIHPVIAIASWIEMSPSVNWELVDGEQELWRRSFTTPAFFESDNGCRLNPTHWQPLPEPPEASHE